MKMDSDYRELDKIYKRRDRYEIPDWQRQGGLWTKSKKQNLLDSVLRGWKLPKFYFVKTDDDPAAYEVVDGQQRMLTLWEFLDNELELADKAAQEFGGHYYKDLPDAVQDAIDDYKIDFDEITEATDDELKEYFQRLQDGLPLTASEKLNSVHSKLRDFARKCAAHRFFSEKTRLSDRRFGYFDVMAKVLAIEIDGIEVGTRFDEIRAVFESQASFSSSSNVAKRVKRALDYLDEGFKDQCALLRHKSVVQSVITLACTLCRSATPAVTPSDFASFVRTFLERLSQQVELGQSATDVDYIDFQRTVNANLRTGAATRQRILMRKLLREYPESLARMSEEIAEQASVNEEIQRLAHVIRTSVHALNEQFGAEHGKDLFKPTNQTANALASLGDPINGFDEYKEFITRLYMLFWEGAGKRFGGEVPESIQRLNKLRTELQHDTDHGKPSKVRTKKRSAGSIFEQYASVKHPNLLAEHEFKFVQMAILADIRDALANIDVSELKSD